MTFPHRRFEVKLPVTKIFDKSTFASRLNYSNIPEHLQKEKNEDKNDNIIKPSDINKRIVSREGKRKIKDSNKDKIKTVGLPRDKSKVNEENVKNHVKNKIRDKSKVNEENVKNHFKNKIKLNTKDQSDLLMNKIQNSSNINITDSSKNQINDLI